MRITGFVSRLIRTALASLKRNPIAWAALFLALGAGAYAANVAPKNSVRSKSIKDGQVKMADLAKSAVGPAQIADGSVTGDDLAGSARPGLDLLKSGPISIDDDADGVLVTTRDILEYGPFTFTGTCRDNGANVTATVNVVSTQSGHVSTSVVSPDTLPANQSRQVAGGGTLTANNTASSGAYVLTDQSRFISLGVFVIARPGGDLSRDCVFHASGWGG